MLYHIIVQCNEETSGFGSTMLRNLRKDHYIDGLCVWAGLPEHWGKKILHSTYIAFKVQIASKSFQALLCCISTRLNLLVALNERKHPSNYLTSQNIFFIVTYSGTSRVLRGYMSIILPTFEGVQNSAHNSSPMCDECQIQSAKVLALPWEQAWQDDSKDIPSLASWLRDGLLKHSQDTPSLYT